ncbi:MAG: hypothetical protein JSS75_07345 [Bacteroidetes bacterium]|nr:hypothetical protein [Bacteroidota bacterium]
MASRPARPRMAGREGDGMNTAPLTAHLTIAVIGKNGASIWKHVHFLGFVE